MLLFNVPEKPVKSRLPKFVVERLTISVPAVILKLGAVPSAKDPGVIVLVPVEPL